MRVRNYNFRHMSAKFCRRLVAEQRQYPVPSAVSAETAQLCPGIDPKMPTSIERTAKYRGAGVCAQTPVRRAAGPTRISVVPDDTWVAVDRMRDGPRPAVLNMANRRWIGGGWRRDSTTQEEQLCRSSTLGVVLEARRELYPMENDELIVSPGILRFRDTAPQYAVLPPENRVRADVVTFAAVDRSLRTQGEPRATAAGTGPAADQAAADAMHTKIDILLARCNELGYTRLVLGAWGCGAFFHDPVTIATLFRDALVGKYAGCFDHVVFAVYDTRKTRAEYESPARAGTLSNYEVFQRVLCGDTTNDRPLAADGAAPAVAE